jgi:hypothetical protein
MVICSKDSDSRKALQASTWSCQTRYPNHEGIPGIGILDKGQALLDLGRDAKEDAAFAKEI